MGKNYDYVSDVNARKFCWNFKVDVIRIWEHPTKFNEKKVGSIEMILQDSKIGKGDTIQCFKNKSNVIPEWLSGIKKITNGSALIKTIDEAVSSKKCPKKVETPVGNRYEFDKCSHTHGIAFIRYKVEVKVFDRADSISFLLWDREIRQLCGKQAEKVLKEDINVKIANISGYDQVFTVMKLFDDEEVVDKNLPKNYDGNSLVNVTDVREDSISSFKYKNLTKRVTSDLRSGSSSANQNEDEGQLSTNKFSRKNAKKQKSIMIDGDN
ncbi:hypothetical protein AHAS_Ahas01G0110100 [Arachis hypogaea]